MKCSNPFVKLNGVAHGCGQCLACRVLRRRVWVNRIMLETSKYAESSFVTLTYANEGMPLNTELIPTLYLADAQNWLKRLRKICREVLPTWSIRFFLVGEYGDKSGRPHFHAALFGYKGCIHGDIRLTRGGREGPECTCTSCSIIAFSWPFGKIHQGRLERASASYIAGYTVKGMTSHEDERLLGRYPEFATMSRRGGIAGSAVDDIAEVWSRYKLDRTKYNEGAIDVGGRTMPLGRYLSGSLREKLGFEKKDFSDAEVQALWSYYERIASEKGASKDYVSHMVYKALRDKNLPYEARLRARRKIFERGKK